MHRLPAIRVGLPGLAALLWGHAFYLRAASGGPGNLDSLIEPGRPWTLLLGLAAAVRLSPDLLAALLGALAAATILWILHDLSARDDSAPPLATLIAPGLVALSPLFAATIGLAPETAVFTALLLFTIRRTFDETGTAGAFSLSILLWIVIGAWTPAGVVLLVAALVHRLLYVQRYRQGRPFVIVVLVWFGLSLAGTALVVALLGGWTGGPPVGAAPGMGPPAGAAVATGAPGFAGAVCAAGLATTRLWNASLGLALLPFLLFFAVTWKPRPIWFLATLAPLLIAAWIIAVGWRGASSGAALDLALAPLVPVVAWLAGAALRATHAALEAGGFRGKPATVAIAGFLAALALATAWPR